MARKPVFGHKEKVELKEKRTTVVETVSYDRVLDFKLIRKIVNRSVITETIITTTIEELTKPSLTFLNSAKKILEDLNSGENTNC